jgi:hypothetical protein
MVPQVVEKLILLEAELISFVLSDEQYTLNITNPEAGASSSYSSMPEYWEAVIEPTYRLNSPHC